MTDINFHAPLLAYFRAHPDQYLPVPRQFYGGYRKDLQKWLDAGLLLRARGAGDSGRMCWCYCINPVTHDKITKSHRDFAAILTLMYPAVVPKKRLDDGNEATLKRHLGLLYTNREGHTCLEAKHLITLHLSHFSHMSFEALRDIAVTVYLKGHTHGVFGPPVA